MSFPRFARIAVVLIAATIPALLVRAAEAAGPHQVAADVSTFTLDNGLQVVVIPDDRTPTVTHMVWYKAGAADEQPGKSGIAHFVEHLMFKGTRAHPAGEFSAKVDEIGGSENAFTTADYTVFHQTVAKQHLRLMMEYEADRMANLVLTNQTLLPERQVILEERRSRTDNDPGAQLGEAVSAALFRNSHYGIPVIGWAHEMAGLTLDDAMAWYNRYYTPNNAIVIIAGDVDLKDVRTFAAETYGNVARRAELSQRLRPTEPPSLTARSVSLSDERVRQPSMMRTYLAPSYATADKGVAEALDVLAEILGGSTTSRLYRQLVVEDGVATSAGAGYQGLAINDTRFSVYASPRGTISLEALAGKIDAMVADLVDKGVTDDEMARAKRRIAAAAIYAQDDQMTLAKFFGTALATGRSLADVEDWLNRIDAVTADQVVAAAKSYLDVRRSVTGYLVGAASETADMAAAPAAMKANVVR
jgi:zinc protease